MPLGLLDATPSMVVRVQKESPSLWAALTTFLQPVTPDFCVTLLAVAFATAAVMMWLETSCTPAEEGQEPELSNSASGLVKSVWLALCQFTGGGGYNPCTTWGRLTVFSWSFVVLVVVAAYTANMATFLIVKETTSRPLSGLLQARSKRVTLCIHQLDGVYERVNVYGKGAFKYYDTHGFSKAEMRQAMSQKKCAAYVGPAYGVDLMLRKEEFNHGCRFGKVGEPIMEGWAGWMISIRGKCSATLLGAMSAILKQLDETEVLRHVYRGALSQERNIKENCDSTK